MLTGTLGFFRGRDHMLESNNGSSGGGGGGGGSGRNNRRLAELKIEAHGEEDESENENGKLENQRKTVMPFFKCWIPLTTYTKSELDRAAPWERYNQLMNILDSMGFTEEVLETIEQNKKNGNENGGKVHDDFSLGSLIQIFRNHDVCRRLTSLAMRPVRSSDNQNNLIKAAEIEAGRGTNETESGTSAFAVPAAAAAMAPSSSSSLPSTTIATAWTNETRFQFPLIRILASIWPQLLKLPPTPPRVVEKSAFTSTSTSTSSSTSINCEYKYEISMVIPAYGESGEYLEKQLLRNLTNCKSPQTVEIIVVDAGGGGEGCRKSLKAIIERLQQTSVVKSKCQDQDDAKGKNDTPSASSSTSSSAWGNIQFLTFTDGGGRGPCLNYGAAAAQGRIVTFCHADTAMPILWDFHISAAIDSNISLRPSSLSPSPLDTLVGSIGNLITGIAATGKSIYNGGTRSGKNRNGGRRNGHRGRNQCRASACAFRFGIDTSPEGLSHTFTSSTSTSGSDTKASSSTYVPPGIRAVETLVNIRSEIYSLPYGDQVISLLKNVFDFLGGYPDQCLMEDYELVTFIRRRTALLPAMMDDYCLETNCENEDEQDQREALAWEREEIKIIPGRPSLCAIRRWQKFGVVYVTSMNYTFVNKYRGGMGANELYKLYYGCDPPTRSNTQSPWEISI